MDQLFCPKCGSPNLKELIEGDYKCLKCGFKGMLGIEQDFEEVIE